MAELTGTQSRSQITVPSQLPFQPGHGSLLAFHDVESSFEANHPTIQTLAFLGESRPLALEPCVTARIKGWRLIGPQDAAAGCCHVSFLGSRSAAEIAVDGTRW